MLKKGMTYTRQELVDMFGTERLDSIKRSLGRQSIEFISAGRGKSFTITITSVPDEFKNICIYELGMPAQTSFRAFKIFFYHYFCDEGFKELPIVEMERLLAKEDTNITRQTIAKWTKMLEDKGLVHSSNIEYTYFATITCWGDTSSEIITKEEYTKAWAAYWNTFRATDSVSLALGSMKKIAGGAVSKRPKVEENGFYSKMIEALVQAIDNESFEEGGK